ncbi:hypothetical protein GOBAR_DD34360 [Gossypium barbadense]|nr:hypothetical protein GOBAR_DD34360 [Gossypium barbadense]
MSELGFDMLFPSGDAWNSFLSTLKNSPDFYLEEDPARNEDVAPSTASDDIAPLIIQTKALMERDYSPASLNMKVGSFGLTNGVGGCSSSLASLDMTVRSFALYNYFGGYDSSHASLNTTAGSFALANCVGGYDSSPVSPNDSWELCSC